MTIRLAYLCGEYPRATDTFIQREIKSLREAGIHIETISVRRPIKREQGSEEQQQERQRTHYLLPCSPVKIIADHFILFAANPGKYIKALWLAMSVRAPGLRALLYQLFYFIEAGLVARRMKQQDLQHIHNHAPDSSGFVAMITSDLIDITFSMTLHGFGILSQPQKWRLEDKIHKALYTICISQYAKSQAMLWSDNTCWNKLHVVHCGIQPEVATVKHHEKEGRNILFVGRFDHVKGLPLLLDAFEAISKKQPKAHLDLVGDGPDRKELEEIVQQKQLTTKVTFHGYQSQAELQDHYANADVFTLTSFAEGIPVVLMEALAYGIPVTAPRITGIPELVREGENGLLFTPGVTEELVANLENILKETALRNKMAAEGRKTVIDNFNLTTETKKLSEIIHKYLDN